MNKKEQRELAAQQEIFAACKSLYDEGVRDYKKLSIRAIRNRRLALLGQGGHQDVIANYRDEWCKKNGLIAIPEKKPEPLKYQVETSSNSAEAPALLSAVEVFLTQQKESLTAEIQSQFEDKVKALEQTVEELKEKCTYLESALEQEKSESEKKQQQISQFDEISKTFVERIESLTKENCKYLHFKSEVKLLEEKLEGEEKHSKQLESKLNNLNQAYKHQATQLKEALNNEKQLKKEGNDLALKCTQLTQLKEQLDKEYQFALQNIERQKDWHSSEISRLEQQNKEIEKRTHDNYKSIFKSVNEELVRIYTRNEEMSNKYIKQQVELLVSMKQDASDAKEVLKSELAVISRRAKDLQDLIAKFEENKSV